MAPAKTRNVGLGSLGVALERRANGDMIVSSTEKLAEYPAHITLCLDHWAKTAPDRVFLAQRHKRGDWQKLTYAETLQQVRHIASALLSRNLSPERPIAILSGNSLEHALLGLAAMYIGIPYSPVSPAYCLISTDYDKLRTIIDRLAPGSAYVAKASAFAKAITATCAPDIEIITGEGSLEDRPCTAFSALASTPLHPGLDAAHAKLGPDTIAKILFTSGSTGKPKGVINTHRMLCANQAMLRHFFAFMNEEPPVLLDWLPWNHTFGGNHNFGLALFNGGTFYIDDGKPTPGGIAETARNLKEVAPTLFFNVPKGYESLIPWLRKDPAMAKNYFSRLRLNFYAGASLPAHIKNELEEIALETVGHPVPMLTSLGSTETAPAALATTQELAKPGNIGVPLPEVQLKLTPSNGKLEVRVRGPNIMPGYWREPEQSAKVFDEEGFYCLGDALKFAQGHDPAGGFVFDGRISEDFKLLTGTWVSVGILRARLIAAAAPYVRDVVIAGHDRDDVTALVFPDLDACRKLVHEANDEALLNHPEMREAFRKGLAHMLEGSNSSSNTIKSMIVLHELPSIDANEVTDKGSINQRAVLERRAHLVEALYAAVPPDFVISAR